METPLSGKAGDKKQTIYLAAFHRAQRSYLRPGLQFKNFKKQFIARVSYNRISSMNLSCDRVTKMVKFYSVVG